MMMASRLLPGKQVGVVEVILRRGIKLPTNLLVSCSRSSATARHQASFSVSWNNNELSKRLASLLNFSRSLGQ